MHNKFKLPPIPTPTVLATLDDGLELTKLLYAALQGQFYVGLTGGLVYMEGARKDIDVILYRNRQQPLFETVMLEHVLQAIGMTDIQYFGFVTKAKWRGIVVDIMHPETALGGEYEV